MTARLPDSRQALADYLDDMLHQATVESVDTAVVGKSPPVLLPGDMLAREIEAPEVGPGGNELDTDEPAPVELTQDEPVPGETREISPLLESQPMEFPLQCLMFRVGDHLLSVPLVQLSGVIEWDGVSTRLPESPGWMLGLVKHRDTSLRIVDSRRLLDIHPDGAAEPGHLLVLGEGGWAMTCDRLGQVVNLEFDDVQWKAADDGGLTLGTIRESLSTLLNPPGITRELDSRAAPRAAEK